jgi:formylglycine-generating enzyme required for sulfatase activity
MAKIFVAYSRRDQQVADAVVKVLREGHGVSNVWYDTTFGGDTAWWSKILTEIEQCKLFLYLVSESSLESKFCQHELREAMRLQKQVLPIMVRPKTDVPGNVADDLKPVLRRTQVIDLAQGVSDYGAVSRMHETIKMRLEQVPATAPEPLTATPTTAPPVSTSETREALTVSPLVKLAIGAIVVAILAIFAFIIFSSDDTDDSDDSKSAAVQPTATSIPTATPVPPTPTPNPFEMAMQNVASNAAWEPITEAIDGADMVLVPMGCFMMGREDGDTDERPVRERCITEPYWIDKTEVTRADYAACVDAGVCVEATANSVSTGDNQPINKVSWFEAYDYCEWRGARLPTEMEWEYAARGPDSLVYPWGNEFIQDNAVVNANETADVGSKPEGASWVGAMDMSGNVWEWASTISPFEIVYRYPYDATDGREANDDRRRPRVVRGGSFDHSAAFVQAANRGRSVPSVHIDNYGFRCAVTMN